MLSDDVTTIGYHPRIMIDREKRHGSYVPELRTSRPCQMNFWFTTVATVQSKQRHRQSRESTTHTHQLPCHRALSSKTLEIAGRGLHVAILGALGTTVDDREGIRHPALLALVRITPMHQVPMEQDQRPLLHLQCLILVFPRPGIAAFVGALRPKRLLQVHEFREPILEFDQSLLKRRRHVRSFGHAKTPVLHCGVLERIPECHCAGWVAEADGAVLVRDELAANAGEFGDELALGDAWVVVA